jgi:hypothetical protein
MQGGQIEGDSSPHLNRIVDEAGASAEQRRAISEAYRTGANEAAQRVIEKVLSPEQRAKTGRRQPRGEVIRHPLVFAVEKLTANRYPDAKSRIETMVKQINEHLRAGGVRREFFVDGIRTYDKEENTGCLQPQNSGGKSLPKEYCSHPLHYILVALDEGAPGANWPCPWISSIEVHGSRVSQMDRQKTMFNERSAMVLCHELGHMLGLPDFYSLKIRKEDNPVNHEEIPNTRYDPFHGCLMDDLGPLLQWDAEIINQESATLPVINHSWIDYQPTNAVLRLIDKTGAPVSGAEVKVYRSQRNGYYKQSLTNAPYCTGTTDPDGKLSLGSNVLGMDPFQALRFFLVEAKQGEKTDYMWFSFLDVNFAFWRGEVITVKCPSLPLLSQVSDRKPRQGADLGAGDRRSGGDQKLQPETLAHLSVPLGSILIDASDVEFFNKVARPTDIIVAKPDTLDLLGAVTAGSKKIFIGPRHESAPDVRWRAMGDKEISSILDQARKRGATMFGYNLENGSKGDPLIQRERQVGSLAHAAGLTYFFGPLIVRLMGPDAEAIAKEADVVVVQAQAFQGSAGFDAPRVLGIIRRLRAANPKVQVHVQISFLNRDTGKLLSADEVIAHLKMIASDVDAVWLFYGPTMVDRFREVFSRLRQPPAPRESQSPTFIRSTNRKP